MQRRVAIELGIDLECGHGGPGAAPMMLAIIHRCWGFVNSLGGDEVWSWNFGNVHWMGAHRDMGDCVVG